MKAFLAAAALSLAALPASASVTFDFTGFADGSQEEIVLSQGGLTVTVTAGAYAFDGAGFFNPDVDGLGNLEVSTQDGAGFFSGDAGIGVVLAGPFSGLLPDINGFTDMLTFTFSEAVFFDEVTFGNVDGSDDVDIFVDGILQLPSDRPLLGNNPFALTGSGTSISFGADALNDNFNIQSITVAAVPLPAALALGLLGFAAFVGYRRMQKPNTA